nr:O-antigen ligase family protein [Massilia terrae]
MSEIPVSAPTNAFATVRVQGLPYAYGLVLAICLNFMQTGGHDRQRVIELILLFAGGCALAYRSPSLWDRTDARVRGTLSVFFALGLLSGVFAFSPRHSLYEVTSLFLLLLSGLAISDALAQERGSLSHVLHAFGAVAALYALKIVCIYVSVWLLTAIPDSGDFTPGFSNIRHLNHVQTIALPLLVLLYTLTPAVSRLRALWMTTLAVWWSVLFATGGRGTEVGLIAATLITFILRRRAAWPFLRVLILSCVIGAIVYVLGFVLAPMMMGRAPFGEAGAMLARTMANPSSGRTFLWKHAFELITAHPMLGVGPLHFAHERAGAAHPHDWMVQIAAEWGLPALLAFSIALFFSFRGLWRRRTSIAATDTLNQNFLSAWLLIGAALLIDASVSGSIVMPQSQLMIVLYIACATGWTWSFNMVARPSPSGMVKLVSPLVVIAAALTLAYVIAPQFVDKATDAEPTAAEIAANGTVEWWPRLWRAGYF